MEKIGTIESRPALDLSLESFKEQLYKAVDLVINRYKNLEATKACSGVKPAGIAEWLDTPLPTNGLETETLLAEIKENVLDTATLNIGPHMYAYVMTGGTQISVIAELLTTAINQNVGKWHLGPVLAEIEQKVIEWGAEFIGYPVNAGGILVSGGSAANLTGLTVARNIFLENSDVRKKGLSGKPQLRVYASTEVHACIFKSVEILGIGSENLVLIPVDDQFRIRIPELVEAIKDDVEKGLTPFCLVGSAGTVNTGAIDSLDDLADIADKFGMWYHVDGAYGALAAAVTSKKSQFRGMERADSLTMDFHKWLYQPFEAGCILIKNREDLRQSFHLPASYLTSDDGSDGRLDFNDYGLQLSRSSKALKVYMTFRAYGAELLRKSIEGDLDNSNYLAQKLFESSDFKVITEGDLGVVCFQYLGTGNLGKEEINRLNRQLIPELELDGRVFITGTLLNDIPVIRACLINHRQHPHHIDYLIQVIREVGKRVVLTGNQNGVESIPK